MQRRTAIELITGAALFGAVAGSGAVPAVETRKLIDVHQHFLPPEYLAAVDAAEIAAPSPTGSVPPWSAAQALALMNELQISLAMLSISAPGLMQTDTVRDAALARSCNEYAARLCDDFPGRFGSLAALPLPNVVASLAELRHAFDVLNADGICLHTHYSGRYLGDAWYRPLLQELHDRKAIVFVHPTTCRCGPLPVPGLPESLIEFPHDTTRAITSLLYAGVFTDLPGIKFIFSHAGGTLPYVAQRITSLADIAPSLARGAPGAALSAALRRQYYDVALSANPVTLQALLHFAEPSQVLLGTDYPFAPLPALVATIAGLESVTNPAVSQAIEYDNAAGLFKRAVGRAQ